ncbi:MAG: arginine N-succinyltransferase [Phycisphaerales bacterium]
MYRIRQARPNDLDTLLKLAKTVFFTNLPADKDGISERIRWSRECFRALIRGEEHDPSRNGKARHGVGGAGGRSPHFMFVLEDEHGQPIGTSAVIAEMGSPGNPNVSLHLRKREMFSSDLKTGSTHVTVQLHLDESGPTEVGGLILAPTFRGGHLGRFLSFVRFHFIGAHRDHFSDSLLAEMMAPISPEGLNPFWEHFGRRFINLSYTEADQFCQRSREFMTSLLPREEIYLSLLPPEARATIGKVAPETMPARRLLEKVGFVYEDRVDPFDGGPHLQAVTDDVGLVRETRAAEISGTIPTGKGKRTGIVSVVHADGADEPFVAVMTDYTDTAGSAGIKIPAAALRALSVSQGDTVHVTPTDIVGATRTASSSSKPKSKPATSKSKKSPSSTKRPASRKSRL